MHVFMKGLTAVLLLSLMLTGVVMGLASLLVKDKYTHNYEMAYKTPPLIKVVDEPYFTNTNNEKLGFLKMGTTVILHQHITRSHQECFAVYVISLRMDNREYKQFPPRYTSVLVERDSVLDIGIDLEIPKDMVEGEYGLYETAFPSCSSFTVQPYDMGVRKTVLVKR